MAYQLWHGLPWLGTASKQRLAAAAGLAAASVAMLPQRHRLLGASSTANCDTGAAAAGPPVFLRVSYTSTMRGDVTVANARLQSIVANSVGKNVKAKLSGHLCYDSVLQQVWQVLEGHPDTVDAVFQQIQADPRHVIDEETISIENVESRKYPIGWGLRYCEFSSNGAVCTEASAKESPLLQIAYKSFLTVTDGEEIQVMEAIIPHAMLKNARCGVTGWLLYNDSTSTVYQVLEGPPAVVEAIWEEIRHDPRHTVAAESVMRKRIAERQFPNWSMSMDKVEKSPWAAQNY